MSRSVRFSNLAGAISGVAFSLLTFISVASVDPQRGISDEKLQTWWADSGNRNGMILSSYALLIACPLFLIFISRLREHLRERDLNGWADLVFGCGIAASAMLGLESILRGVTANAIRFSDEPMPGLDTIRFETNLQFAMWRVVITLFAVTILSTSILVLKNQALPRWTGWLGLAVSMVCFGMIAARMSAFSLPLIFIWVVANCVAFLRSSSEMAESAVTMQRSAPSFGA